MKKLLIAFAAVVVTAVSSFGQGNVLFTTSISGAGISAPVLRPDGSPAGPGYTAGLYLVTGESATLLENSLTTYRDSANATARSHVVAKPVTVDGVAGGSQATFIYRAWETSAGSYEAAVIRGESLPFSVTLTAPPAAPADPVGITGFTMVPEPSTITLGVLGAAALLLRRRK